MRDTDSDWQGIAAAEPFFGVLSQPEFLRENLTPEGLARFWDSGHRDIAWQVDLLRAHFGPFAPRVALDFGCGVGRLTRAMATVAERVYGVDVAPAMLEVARVDAPATIRFVDAIPEEGVDWINSLIVFQHIPPARGVALLADLLARLNPGGAVSLHFTIGRRAGTTDVQGSGVEVFQWNGDTFRPLISAPERPGGMMMYDYDLTQIVLLLSRLGVQRVTLQHTDHGGYYGVVILGRRG